MKTIIIIFAFNLISVFAGGQSLLLEKARGIFFDRWEENCSSRELYEMLEDDEESRMSYVLKAYMGVARAGMAQCVDFPFTKLSYFNEGKLLLEDALFRDAANIEIRFIRYAMQTNIPFFLMYDNIDEDKDFILKELHNENLWKENSIAEKILDYMVDRGDLSFTEKENLENIKRNVKH